MIKITIYYQKAKKLLKQKPLNIKVGRATNTNYNSNLQEKVYKEDYLDMLDRFCTYCEAYNKYPNYIMTKQSKKPSSIRLFCYCINKIEKYYKENGTLPNWCIFDYQDVIKDNNATQKNDNYTNPYTSTPHLLTTKDGLGQEYPWDCSCNALQQALYKLSGKKIPETTLIKVTGCSTNGVGHDGINTAIAWFNKTYGTNYKIEWKNFSDLANTRDERFLELGKLICKPNIAVITHIGYANSGEKPVTSSSTVFGHYEILDKVNVKTKYVRVLNSLGVKMGTGYTGHLQDRTYETQASYFANTPYEQKALGIITK